MDDLNGETVQLYNVGWPFIDCTDLDDLFRQVDIDGRDIQLHIPECNTVTISGVDPNFHEWGCMLKVYLRAAYNISDSFYNKEYSR